MARAVHGNDAPTVSEPIQMVSRRSLLAGLAASPLASPAVQAQRRPTALRMVHASDLQSLDPVWTTSTPTKDYAFFTFDQLIAVDADNVPRPQMAAGWAVEDSGRSVVIGLRDGLAFHDGEPVRARDCIASIARWSMRDVFGQALRRVTDRMEAIDDRRFRIRLTRPFPLLPAALGKSNSSQCFVMPERMAQLDPMQQVTEHVGSGPYRFLRDEWVPGARAAWARNEKYQPRPEPVSGIAGGRIPAVDRVEWSIIGDPSTAYAALQNGEQDLWDAPAPDLIAAIEARPNLVARVRNKTGSYAILQFNHAQPPFNDPAIRRAVAMAVDQETFLAAAVGRPDLIRPCDSFFACDSPYGTDEGSAILKVRSVEKAHEALLATRYNGEKIVLLGVAEQPVQAAMALVADDMLRRIGMTVDLELSDFSAMTTRRTNRGPVAQGGWSLFITTWSGTDILNPAVHTMLRGAGAAAWFGWPDIPEIETLRNRWFDSADPAEQARLAAEMQHVAYEWLPYVPLGSTFATMAYNKALTGMFDCPVAAYWNIGKPA